MGTGDGGGGIQVFFDIPDGRNPKPFLNKRQKDTGPYRP